MNYYNITLSDA